VEARAVSANQLARIRTGAIVAVVLLVIAALLSVGEMRYRTCIEKAETEFPAVPVSAFSGRATGPVKVSFVKERADAVNDCGRL
jgi:hypothetical protein